MVQGGFRAQRPAQSHLTLRRTFAIVALAAVAVAAAACGSGSTTSPTTKGTSTTTATDGTSLTIGIICSTPQDAAATLVGAWAAGDRAAAQRCASADVVTALFGANGARAGWTFAGCSTATVPVCTYRYPGGSARLTIAGSGSLGWKVTKLDR